MNRPPSSSAEWHKTAWTLVLSFLILIILTGLLWTGNARTMARQEVLDARRLAVSQYAKTYTQRSLAERVRDERARRASLSNAWSVAMDRLATLPTSVQNGSSNRIDFKVAYFEAHRRLQQLAAAGGVSIPADLGIAPAGASSHGDAAEALGQLYAIESLVTLAIQHGVGGITSIRLHPATHERREDGILIRHHPIHMTFHASLPALRSLLDALATAPRDFTLTGLQIERKSLDRQAPVSVQWVCDARTAQMQAEESPEEP